MTYGARLASKVIMSSPTKRASSMQLLGNPLSLLWTSGSASGSRKITMNWLKELSDAVTVDEVVQLVNDYILEQPEEYVSWIPKAAQPRLIATEQELHDWNHRIAHELGSATNPNLRLQDLAVFFLRASARVHQLRLRSGAPPEDHNPKAKRAERRRRVRPF